MRNRVSNCFQIVKIKLLEGQGFRLAGSVDKNMARFDRRITLTGTMERAGLPPSLALPLCPKRRAHLGRAGTRLEMEFNKGSPQKEKTQELWLLRFQT